MVTPFFFQTKAGEGPPFVTLDENVTTSPLHIVDFGVVMEIVGAPPDETFIVI
jgi:hypothetical protein